MKKLLWRLRYTYTLRVYASVPCGEAWAMSAAAYEDYLGYNVCANKAARKDVGDWF